MRLLEREARKAGHEGPLAYFHRNWPRKDAPLLDELGAVIDHVDAWSAGGPDDPENLVTACNKCNCRKNSANADKWDEQRPRKFAKGNGEPVSWDGLSRLFMHLALRDSRGLTASEREWLAAIRDAT